MSDKYKINITEELINILISLLGIDNVRIVVE